MNYKTYIIAEAGVNHNGSLDIAKQLIEVAAKAGADAVKFQTFKADRLATQNVPKAKYQIEAEIPCESQHSMLKQLELDLNAHLELKKYCQRLSIEFLSTPFDTESLHILVNQLNVKQLKIASGEITHLPLILEMAKTGKPIILSTGMSSLADIEIALAVLSFGYLKNDLQPNKENFYQTYYSDAGQSILREKVSLLHCVSEYPTPFDHVNLRTMTLLQFAFGLRVGFSDHSLGIAMPMAAVALGASIIEKHFTLDRSFSGPDHAISLEPDELAEMVQSIRQIEQGLGEAMKKPTRTEIENSVVVRKSLVAAKNINKGEYFTEDNIGMKRAGQGLSAAYYWDVLNTVATQDYLQDELIL